MGTCADLRFHTSRMVLGVTPCRAASAMLWSRARPLRRSSAGGRAGLAPPMAAATVAQRKVIAVKRRGKSIRAKKWIFPGGASRIASGGEFAVPVGVALGRLGAAPIGLRRHRRGKNC